MFEKASEAVTCKLQEDNTINEEQYEICHYGLQQGFTVILNVVITLAIGMIIRKPLYAIIFMVLYILLRGNVGGYPMLLTLYFIDNCSSFGNKAYSYTRLYLYNHLNRRNMYACTH